MHSFVTFLIMPLTILWLILLAGLLFLLLKRKRTAFVLWFYFDCLAGSDFFAFYS